MSIDGYHCRTFYGAWFYSAKQLLRYDLLRNLLNYFQHYIGSDVLNLMSIQLVMKLTHRLQVPWYVPCGGVCYGDGNLVFIANDWHTALLPVYLKAYYLDNGLMRYTRSVLVIHNIAHQVG